MQSTLDPAVPHGWHYYWKATHLPELSDDIIDAIAQHGRLTSISPAPVNDVRRPSAVQWSAAPGSAASATGARQGRPPRKGRAAIRPVLTSTIMNRHELPMIHLESGDQEMP